MVSQEEGVKSYSARNDSLPHLLLRFSRMGVIFRWLFLLLTPTISSSSPLLLYLLPLVFLYFPHSFPSVPWPVGGSVAGVFVTPGSSRHGRPPETDVNNREIGHHQCLHLHILHSGSTSPLVVCSWRRTGILTWSSCNGSLTKNP